MIIGIWPFGRAVLVKSVKEIPDPWECLGGWDGYQVYRSNGEIWAVEE